MAKKVLSSIILIMQIDIKNQIFDENYIFS